MPDAAAAAFSAAISSSSSQRPTCFFESLRLFGIANGDRCSATAEIVQEVFQNFLENLFTWYFQTFPNGFGLGVNAHKSKSLPVHAQTIPRTVGHSLSYRRSVNNLTSANVVGIRSQWRSPAQNAIP